MTERPPLRLVPSAALPDDPMLAAVQHYERGVTRIDDPGISDYEIGRRFAAALAPIHANPVATTVEGAAAALRLALSFEGMDATDRGLVSGVLAFLETRTATAA